MSASVRNLQKQLQSQNRKSSKKQFIPFIQERNLGKLIVQTKQLREQKNKRLCIDDINFRNFKKIYNRERVVQNARYSQMTRNSQQNDLISYRGDWKINKVNSQRTLSNRSQLLGKSRQCCFKIKMEYPKKSQKFDKIDEDVYKKILSSKPQQNLRNPQIQTLFSHYVKVCQLNENIRRLELTRKRKW